MSTRRGRTNNSLGFRDPVTLAKALAALAARSPRDKIAQLHRNRRGWSRRAARHRMREAADGL